MARTTQTSIVPDAKALLIANDLSDQFRYYTSALADVQRFAETAINDTARGIRPDASWILQYATKAAEYQREIETLVRMAKLVGLTKEQIELAASSARVWFQTPEEAAEYEAEMERMNTRAQQ